LALLAAGTRGIDAFEGDGGNTTVSSEVAAVIGVAPVADLTEWARRPTMAKLFEAIADAMAFFIARYVPVRASVTTS
jgi:hypothetical protein